MRLATGSPDHRSRASGGEQPLGGRPLSYVVKWILVGESKNRESPDAYRDASQAIDFACTMLKQNPASIWIEGPGGVRIERGVIELNCEARRSVFR